jgi:flagellin
MSASSIAVAVNAVSGTTNVTAQATSVAKLSNLSANGSVTFDLYGSNSIAASVTATVSSQDLTSLVQSINNVAGNTGITAAVGTNNSEILLTHATGKDIKIQGFTHSAAQSYQHGVVAGDGSGVIAPSVVSMQVTGNPSTNVNGTAVTLYDGGLVTNMNSTVVGGELKFSSSNVFSVSSSIASSSNNLGLAGRGSSLVSGLANTAATSTLSAVNSVDISSAAGAQSAISVLDEAINQVSEIRANLGALGSRFSSAIENLANNVESLSAARSRILDADFASETAALTKNQILQQAGISILSQANQIPQNVLSLLR